MTVQSSQGLASRLGYGLGRGVRFFLADENVVLRWTKRLVLFAAILFFSTVLFHWLAGAIMTMVSFGLILWAAVKGDASVLLSSSDSECWGGQDHNESLHQDHQEQAIWRDGPEGWGYYRVDDVRLDF
ncbi:hypothetical protein HX866_03285 [Pseudomonas gingeri]|uniref:hypothetical protein n=1 Tax=Pseudomonas gingeri TaxID=117681 RepID=UPI0015A2ED58|nr:hypothetical protein [Pseudomonas gingeri]NWA23906.1 hypothetical protein [Pseudomonas gingeri]